MIKHEVIKRGSMVLLAAFACLGSAPARADLDIGPPATIIERVTMQPIIVSNSDGTNTAGYFGDAVQQGIILGLIDSIWAQAGIDIEWLTPNVWNNTFANMGNPAANSPRPTSDLDAIVSAGDIAGVGSTDPDTLDIYFVEIAAGFEQLGQNTANGLAFVGGNGITAHVGDALPGFTGGQEVVASVIAHEIGHNLGLFHTGGAGNLMVDGARLNATQITTALSSSFSRPIAVPEPSGAILMLIGLLVAARRHRSSGR